MDFEYLIKIKFASKEIAQYLKKDHPRNITLDFTDQKLTDGRIVMTEKWIATQYDTINIGFKQRPDVLSSHQTMTIWSDGRVLGGAILLDKLYEHTDFIPVIQMADSDVILSNIVTINPTDLDDYQVVIVQDTHELHVAVRILTDSCGFSFYENLTHFILLSDDDRLHRWLMFDTRHWGDVFVFNDHGKTRSVPRHEIRHLYVSVFKMPRSAEMPHELLKIFEHQKAMYHSPQHVARLIRNMTSISFKYEWAMSRWLNSGRINSFLRRWLTK